MKKMVITICIALISHTVIFSQTKLFVPMDSLPYYHIPDYPDQYLPGNVAARMIDGLGYRYYWATEGLTAESLAYKPSEDSRTIMETMEHIHGLTRTTLNATKNEANVRLADQPKLSYKELRQNTLENILAARQAVQGKTAEELEALHIIFQRADRTAEFPFWNLLNGPLADAIYHTGQIVGYRRAAGNPVDIRMNVFTGKTRE